MNSSTRKPYENAFRFSFFRNKKNDTFLNNDHDLEFSMSGKSLTDLISLNSNDFDGIELDEFVIDDITQVCYEELLTHKISIKNSNVFLFIYTLCKLDDVVLFLVWRISTEVFEQDRSTWEEYYGLVPGECCKKTYFSNLQKKQNSVLLQDKESEFLFEKNCQFKKPYIKCLPLAFSTFFNQENPIALKRFKESWFNIPVTGNFILNGFPDEALFCYDGTEKINSLLCTSLYDSILLDTTGEKTIEHNLKNFLSDSLLSCFNYQETIDSRINPFRFREQRLLCLSLYL